MSTEIARTVNATVPSIRLLAGCLGIMLSEKDIEEIGSGMFPKSPQELFIAHLTEDICRAYSGDVQPLTTDFLIGKVSRLVPFNSFQLERELKQCAACCVPMYDDLRPHTALLALDSSRHLNNRYQAVFGVVLTIEVLARLVKYNASLRFEFEESACIIINNSYLAAAHWIENRIANIQESRKLLKQIEHDLEAVFSAQFSGGHNG